MVHREAGGRGPTLGLIADDRRPKRVQSRDRIEEARKVAVFIVVDGDAKDPRVPQHLHRRSESVLDESQPGSVLKIVQVDELAAWTSPRITSTGLTVIRLARTRRGTDS